MIAVVSVLLVLTASLIVIRVAISTEERSAASR